MSKVNWNSSYPRSGSTRMGIMLPSYILDVLPEKDFNEM